MNNCPDCKKGFSRRDNMLRHQRHMHDGVTEAHLYPQENMPPPLQEGMPSLQAGKPSPPPPPPPQQQQQGVSSPQEVVHSPPPPHGAPHRQDMTVLYHPFTMMISGPTACGKTTFVRNLLQNHIVRIQPGIQRIVWLYKRWQPLYDIIQRTVIPKVEFIQGIPADLDDDDYFDSKVNNLLIIDDLFSESGKDKRITDLFTEGSHPHGAPHRQDMTVLYHPYPSFQSIRISLEPKTALKEETVIIWSFSTRLIDNPS